MNFLITSLWEVFSRNLSWRTIVEVFHLCSFDFRPSLVVFSLNFKTYSPAEELNPNMQFWNASTKHQFWNAAVEYQRYVILITAELNIFYWPRLSWNNTMYMSNSTEMLQGMGGSVYTGLFQECICTDFPSFIDLVNSISLTRKSW